MLKKHTFWLKMAAVLQLLTAAAHSLSFMAPVQPANDQERQLHELMTTYHMDGGMGFRPTTHDLLTALSAALPVLYVFGALITFHLLRKKIGVDVMRGVVRIEVLVFGAYFLICSMLTFPPPIICTGLVFLALVIGLVTMPKRTA